MSICALVKCRNTDDAENPFTNPFISEVPARGQYCETHPTKRNIFNMQEKPNRAKNMLQALCNRSGLFSLSSSAILPFPCLLPLFCDWNYTFRRAITGSRVRRQKGICSVDPCSLDLLRCAQCELVLELVAIKRTR